MYKNNKALLTLSAAVALSSLTGVALADYPERDIRVIVPCMQKTSRVA